MSEALRTCTVPGLARLALPLAASTGLGFFLQYVNRTVLSWHSPDALAAALPAGLLAWTFQGFVLLTCGYLGVFAAQHVGANEDDEAGAMVWPMVWFALICTAVCLAMIPFRHQIVSIFATEARVEAPLAELFAWYLAEAGPMALAGGIGGFCGGIGKTRLVMGVSIFGAALCIALNALLVLGWGPVPALGVTGAGLATLGTALAVLGVWLVWLFAPAQEARFRVWGRRNADFQRLARFCRFAVPRGATEILEMASFIAFSAVITRLGTTALAASNLAFNTYLLVLVPVIGFCQGLGIAVGQAVGEGRPDLARQAVRSALWILVPYMVVLMAAFGLIPELLLAPAKGEDAVAWQEQVALAIPVMWCLIWLIPVDGLQWIWRFAVQGAGDTRWPMVMVLSLALVFLALPAWIMYPYLTEARSGLIACYLLMAAYTTLLAGMMAWRFYRGPWATMTVRKAD